MQPERGGAIKPNRKINLNFTGQMEMETWRPSTKVPLKIE